MASIQQGWLMKQTPGVFRNWQKRWCVLAEKSLYYYKKEGETENQGIIPLQTINMVHYDEKAHKGCRFDVEVISKRTYSFMAQDKLEALAWIGAIEKASGAPDIKLAKQASVEEAEAPIRAPIGRDPTFTIAVLKARGLAKMSSGESLPNLYTTLDVIKAGEVIARRRTQVISKSVAPQWNADFPLHLDSKVQGENWMELKLHFSIWHQKATSDVSVGEFELELKKHVREGQKKVKWFRLEAPPKSGGSTSGGGGRRSSTSGSWGLLQLGILIESAEFMRAYALSQFGRDVSDVSLIKLSDEWGYKSPIPQALVVMRNYLLSNQGFELEGVFRIAPVASETAVVKEKVNSGVLEKVEDQHCLSHLIKVFYRDLPVKVLDGEDLKSIAACSDETFAMAFIEALPEPKQSLFLWLLDLCVIVCHHADKNKMDPQNVSIVFGPNLMSLGKDAPGGEKLTGEHARSPSEVILKFNQQLSKFAELAIKGRIAQVTATQLLKAQAGTLLDKKEKTEAAPPPAAETPAPTATTPEAGTDAGAPTDAASKPSQFISLFLVGEHEVEQADSDDEEDPEDGEGKAPEKPARVEDGFVSASTSSAASSVSPQKDGLAARVDEIDALLYAIKDKVASGDLPAVDKVLADPGKTTDEAERDVDIQLQLFEKLMERTPGVSASTPVEVASA